MMVIFTFDLVAASTCAGGIPVRVGNGQRRRIILHHEVLHELDLYDMMNLIFNQHNCTSITMSIDDGSDSE